MENVFLHLLNMSLTAAVLVLVVLWLRVIFHRAPRWIHCLLWALVAVRLVCPFTIESNLSLMPENIVVSVPENSVIDAPQVEMIHPNTSISDASVPDMPVADPNSGGSIGGTVGGSVSTPVVTPTPDASLSATTPEYSADPWQIALAVATYAWLVGVAVLAVYAVVTTLRLRRKVGEAAHLEGNLWHCDHIRSPFILGVFRPRIYLPSDLSGAARDSVIAHEQAHLHRRDHWWKPLGFVLLMVYWFNPLMWVAYVLLCRDIEAACDERVVRDMPTADRKAYSEALLSCSAPRRLVSACPLAFGETSVKSRIKSVLNYKKPTIWIIVAALLASIVAGVCLLTDPKTDRPDTKKPSQSTETDEDDDRSTITTDDDDPIDHTAINAQVTGIVLEWNKEGEYLLLQVKPQFSDALGDTLKVYTQNTLASCAPEVGDHLRILYEGYVERGNPNAIYAASLWGETNRSIIKTGVDLYDDLLREITDYCYGLASSAQAPDCSYLIFKDHLDPMFQIGVKLMDLDKNGQNDLLISEYNGLYGTCNEVYDAYTIKNGKLVHLLSTGERNRYYLHEGGYVSREWAESAAISGTDFYRLTDGVLTFLERVTHDDYYAVEIGLVDSMASITEVFWFHTTHTPDGSNEGYVSITEQQAQDRIDAFTAAHPKWDVNFLSLESGVTDPTTGGATDTTTAPATATTTTTTKPTTTTTKPTTTKATTSGTTTTTMPPATTTTAPTVPAIPTSAEVGDTLVVGGLGMWRDEILEEVYGDQKVRVFHSYEELDAFLNTYAGDDRYLKRNDFVKFNADWFVENALLMTYYIDGSCSVHPTVGAYSYNADGTALSICIDVYVPGAYDDAMGGWHMFSGIRKADLKGVTELTAYVRAMIPEHYYIALFTEPTRNPQTAPEQWRTWLPDEEGWDLSRLVSQWNSAGLFVDVTRACKYIAAFQLNGHIHYVSEDYAALQRDDGKLYWLTEYDANLIKRIIAIAETTITLN